MPTLSQLTLVSEFGAVRANLQPALLRVHEGITIFFPLCFPFLCPKHQPLESAFMSSCLCKHCSRWIFGRSDRFLACRKGHWQNSPAVKRTPSMKKDGCHILRCSKKEIRASRHTSIWAQHKTLNPQTQYPSPGKSSPTSKQEEHQHLLKIHLQFSYH